MIASITVARPLVIGIANGAGYGLVAIGLVLIYKSSRVFNFAAGEFVTLGAYATYLAAFHVPYVLAIVAGVLAGLGAGLATERLVIRPLSQRPKVTVLVATAAVATAVIPLEIIVGQLRTFPARPVIKSPLNAFHLFGVYVSWQQLLIVLTLAAAGGGLAYFFARTDLGLATLASSQEAIATRLMGIRLHRISSLTWGTAGALGGLAGVLLAPVTFGFTPAFGTTDVLIAAFTAAVLGGMTSVPGAFVGGVLVGVVQSLAQFNLGHIPGANSLAVFVVLVAVLLVRPTGLLGTEA